MPGHGSASLRSPAVTDERPHDAVPVRASAAAEAPPAAPAAPGEPYALVGPPRNEGHGKRLTAAFEALELFPALAESRNRRARPRLRGAPLDRRRRPGDRVRRRARHRRAAARQRARLPAPRPGRGDRRRRRGALARGRPGPRLPTPRRSSSSSAARRGTRRPSASACTPSPSSARPTGSPPRPATRTATACSSPRCCTTSASSCSCTPTRATRSRSTAPRARRRSGCTTSAASWASTTRWSAACSPAAGTCRKPVASAIERHHADDAQGDAAFVRLADMLAHYSQGSPVSSTELLQRRPRRRLRPERAAHRPLRPAVPEQGPPARGRALPALHARARGPQAPRPGHGLQADRARALALHEHGAHAPAQHLRQARRGRPRPGRAPRHRARLALSGLSRNLAAVGAPARTCPPASGHVHQHASESVDAGTTRRRR